MIKKETQKNVRPDFDLIALTHNKTNKEAIIEGFLVCEDQGSIAKPHVIMLMLIKIIYILCEVIDGLPSFFIFFIDTNL